MRPRLIIPESSPTSPTIPTRLILQELPLEGIRTERHHVTGELEFVAPEGFAFQMTGEFNRDSDQNRIEVWGPPTPSRQTLVSYMAEMKAKLQEGVHDPEYYSDEIEDLEAALESSPTEFIGTSLTFSVLPYSDVEPVDPGQAHLTDEQRSQVTVEIRGDVEAWYETGLQDFSYKIAADSEIYDITFIDIPLGILYWRRWISSGNLLSSAVELVPYSPKAGELQVVTLGEEQKQLQILQDRYTSEGAYRYEKHLDRLFGQEDELTETERKRQIMLEYREKGKPLAQDPLKDLLLIRGEAIDIDRAAQKAFESCGKPPGFAEALAQEDAKIMQRNCEAAARRLRSALMIIEHTAPLDQLVQERASQDWVERELSL